jgi:BMFP domain-containing protein YqiC
VNAELDQLRAENASMRNLRESCRLCGLAIGHVDSLISENEQRIAKLEAEAADPWRDAKGHIKGIERTDVEFPDWQKEVARYVRHIESENARLTARAAELEKDIAEWKKAANHQNILANHYISTPQNLVCMIESELEWRYQAKARIQELESRVAELEAALRRIATVPDCGCVPCRGQCDSAENLRVNTEEIREIARSAVECVKPITDMHPPFEGPIVGIEPVLDPARVLATARKWFMETEFSIRDLETINEVIRVVSIQLNSRDAKPYPLKKGGSDGE